jgi:hypothetical protein
MFFEQLFAETNLQLPEFASGHPGTKAVRLSGTLLSTERHAHHSTTKAKQ